MIVEAMEVARTVCDRLRISQDQYKHGADAKRRHLEFTKGDLVFLRISLTRGLIRFGCQGKLSPMFIGPFSVDARVGEVAYRLVLPDSLVGVHPVFHVSQLWRCIEGQTRFVDFSEIEVRPDLTYEQQPVEILDHRVKSLRSKQVQLVRVSWQRESPGESTWELEGDMMACYPYLLSG